jgi:hypothetical protein
MTPNAATLGREAAIFSRYFGVRTPPPSVGEKYVLGHGALPDTRRDLLDRALLAFASAGSWATGVADSYAALFRRDAVLRLKLVLLLAILENTAGVHADFDEGIASSRAGVFFATVGAGLRWGARLLAGLVVFTPVQLIAAVTRRPRG